MSLFQTLQDVLVELPALVERIKAIEAAVQTDLPALLERLTKLEQDVVAAVRGDPPPAAPAAPVA